MSLDHHVAVVTGGASGIGKATCLVLAEKGAKLVIVDLEPLRLEALLGVLRAKFPLCEAMSFVADVQNPEAVEAMVHAVDERFGRIDLLVHSAGILRLKGSGPKLLHQTSVEEFDAVVGVNLKGTFLTNRAVLRLMMRQRRGHIVNISSTSGIKGRAFDSVYCASKFGMIGLSEALAEEVRAAGIKVHVILPDAVDTPIWQQNGPVQPPEDTLPPERVADLILYLAELPEDTILDHLVIRAFRSRRKRKKTTDPGIEAAPNSACSSEKQ
ncbi:MAG: SDR family oxidoreductase [Proteobacteria bacterium]|nr:SDR family oxidoreductase [Desulfobulbaceae bacterium]MBU4152225.1 SDR family oxidoreductase [Pseudomonadota bacterium]MDP2105110.1 SDR family oxidoreductase [Desulfobulbaceae bacterium]